MTSKTLRAAALFGAAALTAGGASAAAAMSTTSHDSAQFRLVRSTGSVASGCLVHATARVNIKSRGPVEVMTIDASGLPKNTGFDVFVIQLPDAPFGVSWYQGDLNSNAYGNAHGQYVGRFSVETFSVAPGSGPAPVVHRQPTKDANTNPATAPIHQYHIGVWFNSPKKAAAAGCANVVTPFNGNHNAGPQALSTRQFPDLNGPLRRIRP